MRLVRLGRGPPPAAVHTMVVSAPNCARGLVGEVDSEKCALTTHDLGRESVYVHIYM